MIKQLKDQQIKQLKEKKEKKKNIEKTRKKAIKGLVDFNNFIRDDVGEPRQKDRLTQQLLISNKKSSRTIDDEKKKVMNLFNALATDSKCIFSQQIK